MKIILLYLYLLLRLFYYFIFKIMLWSVFVRIIFIEISLTIL